MSVPKDALAIFNAAIAAVQPAQLLPLHLAVHENALFICNHIIPFCSFKHIYVIGAGKAAAAMAVETENIIGGYIADGLVITKYDHALPSRKIKIVEGAHPVPDENCIGAVKATLQLLQQVTQHDIIICLISGGASSLWCDVPEGVTLQDIQTTFNQLITCGAAIQEINFVRKHLSSVKGGQLVRHCNGAKVFTLIISDVPGNDISSIASGPTVGDATSFEDAYYILVKYGLFSHLPQSVQTRIYKGLKGEIRDTPKPGDALFQHTINTIIGNNELAVNAAATMATRLGYAVYVHPSLITGDAETEAKRLVHIAQQYKGNLPVCIIQGGETTVKVSGNGLGGRNQHFVLAALNELNNNEANGKNILVLSGGTDGTDGPTNATGAMGDKQTAVMAKQKNLLKDYLHRNDSYHFFEKTGGLLITGATQTNVMDIMMAIVY